MVTTGLTWFLVSAVLFIVLLLSVEAERKRGKRFLLKGFRGWLDKHMAAIGLKITQSWDHFMKYIVQLSWYYTIHSFLQTVLKAVVAFYERIEHKFEMNRRRTKQLRAEKNHIQNGGHLAEISQHKKDTALTPAQQRRLRDKQLKGD